MRYFLLLWSLFLLGCSSGSEEEPKVENLYVNSIFIGSENADAENVEVELMPEIKVKVSQSMSPQFDFKSFIKLLNQNGDAMEMVYSLSENNQTIIIKPVADLGGFQKYTLLINRGLSSEVRGVLQRECTAYFYTTNDQTDKFPRISDAELLDKVQAQTFKYFWDFAHSSGMIRERNTSQNTVTTGGTGFGLMAIAVGVERKFITKSEGLVRVNAVVDFLEKADKYKGAFSHWYDGSTAKTQPFSTKDNGADLVETGFLMMGLLTAAEYFDDTSLRNRVNTLYQNIEWNHFLNYSESLYWHWSPEYNFELQLKIQGWNEALMTYILAAGSDKYAIAKENYTRGWTRNGAFVNNNLYDGIKLPLGSDYGGPLFISQYTFLGIDPNKLSDDYISDYAEQCKNHTLINRAYCIQNPNKHPGYNQYSWGLTASDNPTGYSAHSPRNDLGVITPTAALGSFAFTPVESKEALEFFYYKMGDKLWSDYGFRDAYSVKDNWYAGSYISIDQGPIILSIENHRSGLLWKNCLKSETVKKGMSKLGLTYR
jgi:hypothetical protein